MDLIFILHLLSKNLKNQNMKAIMIAAIFFGLGNMLSAQVTTGTLSGKVMDAISKEGLPGARVWIPTDNGVIRAACDTAGNYKIDALKPGIYNVYARFSGLDTALITGVVVTPDVITFLDFNLTAKSTGIVVVTYTAPVIDKYMPRIKISTEYIEQSLDIRNPMAMLSSYSSEIKLQEGTGAVMIRGSRPGDAVYYIDGVKMTDLGTIPGASIGSMEAYTGGIPAKYGDTTGGVVILETKSYFDLYNAWLAGQ